MKIAIVGSGVSGMVAAWLLHRRHEITVFEADSRIGGHVNTIECEVGGRVWPVDTGFIVFNDRTYPNFLRLLERLGVESKPTTMSFGVSDERTGLEYCGHDLDSLFAQRGNAVRTSFLRMLLDVARFNREGRAAIAAGDESVSMADWLDARGYSPQMREQYLVPMMSAIWSADPARAREFPAIHFLRFFENHGLLSLSDRPQWRVVRGGSRTYADALVAHYRDRVRTSSPVESIRRVRREASDEWRVEVTPRGGDTETFDRVVIAAHSDQALRMLADATDAERDVLGAIPYQANEAVLHTDESVLPKARRARAAWNYHLDRDRRDRARLTYDMNLLQGLDAPARFLVTLNDPGRIDPAKVIRRIAYAHPEYSFRAIAAQKRHAEIDGARATHFCGAYWGYGFHEDGVRSAMAAVARLRDGRGPDREGAGSGSGERAGAIRGSGPGVAGDLEP